MSDRVQVDAATANTSADMASVPDTPEALLFKQRMLEWPNPVEYVNNMYGCHPGDGNTEYFKVVYAP